MARPKTSKPFCTVANCEGKTRAKDLCVAHYDRLRKTGTLDVDVPVGDKTYRGNKITIGKTGKKRKGTPWNKGISFMPGSLSPNWKGGVTKENHKIRRKFEYTLRKKVLLRDDYTCQVCQTQPEDLHVDHIKSWTDYPELRFDIDNCRTLCVPCHYFITFKRQLAVGKSWCGFTRSEA